MPADDLTPPPFPPTAEEAEHYAARLESASINLWERHPAEARLCEQLAAHFRTFAREERAALPRFENNGEWVDALAQAVKPDGEA